jgi:acetyl esterase/lipase
MRTLFILSVLLSSMITSLAQMLPEIPLWPNGAPGALGTQPQDIPTLTPYLPATNATGTAMLICPGGGYVRLAPHEGNDYALWLNQHGITCFVLKSRLGSGNYHYPVEFEDVSRAMRMVRANAAQWHIDPNQIGVMGSSAGGHLASMLLTHFDDGDPKATDPIDRQSSRPDLGILCYAVIDMSTKYVHQGSKENLLGPNPKPGLAEFVSSQLQVKSNTPPCFIWCTYEDTTVPMENSLMFAEALRKQHVPFDLHIYQKGHHGIGLADKPPFAHPHPWAGDLLYWLKAQNFLGQ